MEKQSTRAHEASRVRGENLETWVRDHVQGFIQQVLGKSVRSWGVGNRSVGFCVRTAEARFLMEQVAGYLGWSS